MQLSIIIVNYNVKCFLEHCLHAVLKAAKNIDTEILVVDNNSTDGSREYLEPKFPQVKFFWNKNNPGFAKANNEALSRASGDYILFLNPDTIVAEDCFKKCMDFFMNHKDCGALGVKMIDGKGKFLRESKRGLPLAATAFFKMSGLIKIFPTSKTFAAYYAAHLPDNENNITEVLAGAFMMLSATAISIAGSFDEFFFMYGEDIDLSYRITKAGLNNYYFAESPIIHFKGESTQKKSSAYNKNFYGAMKYFTRKHFSHKGFTYLFANAAISASRLLSFFKYQLTGAAKMPGKHWPGKTIIYGTEQDVAAIQKITSHTRYSLQVILHINSFVSSLNFKEIFKTNYADSIIFCEGLLSYETIISQLQCIPDDCSVFFFYDGAESIISSGNKNEKGLAITAG